MSVEPTTETDSTSKLRASLGDFLKRVAYSKLSLIVTTNDKAPVVVISLERYAELLTFEKRRKN
jgi:prevent-host-death family protein